MKSNAALVIFTLLAISFPREALVSGNANFMYLDPHFQLEYTENSRKIVSSDQYDDYWKQKAEAFERGLTAGLPHYRSFLEKVRQANVPLAPLPLNFRSPQTVSRAQDLSTLPANTPARIRIDGKKGFTEAVFQFNRALTLAEAEVFYPLLKHLDYETPAAESVKLTGPSLVELGLIVFRVFPKFSFAVVTPAYVSQANRPTLTRQMEAELSLAAEKIRAGYEKREKEGKVWLDPAQLISLERKLGDRYKTTLENPRMDQSVFNPYGPIFDDFGRRTLHHTGSLIYSMLFVSDRSWDETPKWAANRGEFEAWFRSQLQE